MKYFLDSGPIIGYSSFFKVTPYEKMKNSDLDPHSEKANWFFENHTNNITSKHVFNEELPRFLTRRQKAVNLLIRKLVKKRIRPNDESGLIPRDFKWVSQMYSKLNKPHNDKEILVIHLREYIAILHSNSQFCESTLIKEIYSEPYDSKIISELDSKNILHSSDRKIFCHAIQYHNNENNIEIVTCDKDWCTITLELDGLEIPKSNYLLNL